ncbi:hypothetical protein FCY90_23930 [Escherichia coli]|nr:hypothetical protein [Escherichia coli]
MPFITPSLPRIYTVYNDSDIVTRICRASGMEGGTPLFHMIPPKPDVSRYSRFSSRGSDSGNGLRVRV